MSCVFESIILLQIVFYMNLGGIIFHTLHNIKYNLCGKTEILPCIQIKYIL